MAYVTPASNVSDNDVIGMAAVLDSDVVMTSHIWTPEVVARVTAIVVIMAATLTGNAALITGITCHVALRRRRVSAFLVNLAVGDLLVCLVTMTSEILFVAFGEWVLGAAGCKLVVYGQIVTLASTTFLLTAMSIDSYQVLAEPLQSLRSGRPSIRLKVITAWLMALVFAIPQLFIFVQTADNGSEAESPVLACRSHGYTAEWQRKVYFSFLTCYILVIPTAIMSFCYLNIVRVVWSRSTDPARSIAEPRLHFVTSRRSRSRSSGSADQAGAGNVAQTSAATNPQPFTKVSRRVVVTMKGGSRLCHVSPVALSPTHLTVFTLLPKRFMSSSKRQVVRMSLSVIVVFVVCWSPYFIVSLIRIFSDYRVRLSSLLSAAELLALAHSALNPIIYGAFSAKTLHQSCSHRCQQRRRLVAQSRWCLLFRCCNDTTVADMSPDAPASAVAAPPPLPLTNGSGPLQQPAIELRRIAYVASAAVSDHSVQSCNRPGFNANGRPISALTLDASSSSTTTTEDNCCRKSASAEFQHNVTSTLRAQCQRTRRLRRFEQQSLGAVECADQADV